LNSSTPTFEFHVSRRARDRYQFDDLLFSLTGNLVFANFHAARVFAQKMNERRDLVSFPEQAVKSGQLSAMGLIDEILHFVAGLYREQVEPRVMADATAWLEARIGAEALDQTLRRFADGFPTVAHYRRQIDLDQYLQGETAGVPNRQIVLEELLLLWLANVNPAFAPYLELFEDDELRRETGYQRVVAELGAFFEQQPPFGPDQQSLVEMLRSPALASPHSLEGQLTYILERWGGLLGSFAYRLLSSLDVIEEERKVVFLGPGPARVYEFGGLQAEPEAYSAELDWMPSLVLMAKNAYVWLDQLSKRYQRPVARLDQVPDEELATLARWGFSGLWLIGVWERSAASQRIKQLCGNPEAVASAYSLYDYVIAEDLGGESAYQDLKQRAWRHGIRMASDMVPNHVGIYSRWVVEHPDWFVSLDYNPYPWYSYGGPDLSQDDRVGLFIEDHYFDRTDAAVAFKRVDRQTGQERFVYHGNDGTSMPWNDTAQLNYLNPDVREAVIQTILHVARQFPVIRFDAAMTLAKRHYQRLWFPEPGSGGAIPTRAEHGLTREQFEAAMPREFWREVVDRVAVEAPDTLLLAEAFWLLEGYFVRTLGMHRVYNSAFMNMLRDEDNASYRQVIKNTLEFDPEVLRRFVNFMNNPDERTAVDQFGKDDKYFGVCTLLATMPGLPMFGHGQIEGLTEKYGMEYRRAYWDESPDLNLLARHEREIFPLLRQRKLFAGVENFLLYDLFAADGSVNEDVFAYSNRLGEQRGLVLYNNAFREARGWVRGSAAFAQKSGPGDDRTLTQRPLADGLALESGDDWFTILRDHLSGLEYLRGNRQLHDEGFYCELGAYKCLVFADLRQVQDGPEQHYAALAEHLAGRAVPSVDQALREVLLRPIQQPLEALLRPDLVRRLMAAGPAEIDQHPDSTLLSEVEQGARALVAAVQRRVDGDRPTAPVEHAIMARLSALLRLANQAEAIGRNGQRDDDRAALRDAAAFIDGRADRWVGLLTWIYLQPLGALGDPSEPAEQARSWFDEWLLARSLQRRAEELGLEQERAALATVLARVLMTQAATLGTSSGGPIRRVAESLLRDSEAVELLQLNRHGGVLWFNQERFEELCGALLVSGVILATAESTDEGDARAAALAGHYQAVQALRAAEQRSEFQVEKLLQALSG
jgi:glycosidase